MFIANIPTQWHLLCFIICTWHSCKWILYEDVLNRTSIHATCFVPGVVLKGQMGMCCSNGSLFYKKSFNMGPVFYKKICKSGSSFLTEPKFSRFCMAKTQKNHKICEKLAYFSRKILNNGYPLLPKWPLKMGRGFEARAAHPCPQYPNQIWVPPRVLSYLFI